MTERERIYNEFCVVHAAELLRWAERRVGWSDAQDVVQETLLRAWLYLDSFKPSSARAWMFTVARRLLPRVSRLEFLAEAQEEELAAREASPGWMAEMEDELAALARLADGRPPAEREMIRALIASDFDAESARRKLAQTSPRRYYTAGTGMASFISRSRQEGFKRLALRQYELDSSPSLENLRAVEAAIQAIPFQSVRDDYLAWHLAFRPLYVRQRDHNEPPWERFEAISDRMIDRYRLPNSDEEMADWSPRGFPDAPLVPFSVPARIVRTSSHVRPMSNETIQPGYDAAAVLDAILATDAGKRALRHVIVSQLRREATPPVAENGPCD